MTSDELLEAINSGKVPSFSDAKYEPVDDKITEKEIEDGIIVLTNLAKAVDTSEAKFRLMKTLFAKTQDEAQGEFGEFRSLVWGKVEEAGYTYEGVWKAFWNIMKKYEGRQYVLVKGSGVLNASDKKIRDWLLSSNAGIYSLAGKTDNMYVVDGAMNDWDRLPAKLVGRSYGRADTREVSEYAMKQGYSGVIIKDIYDSMVEDSELADIYIYFNPGDLKSLDTVTYDDEGHVIPLSERFNEEKKDLRYSFEELDDQYMKAVDSGNTEEQERLVAAAAAKAGYNESVFHGTRAEEIFNVFESGSGQFGQGVYFTKSENIASGYGKVLKFFVKITKIADYDDNYRLLGKTSDMSMDEFAAKLGYESFDEMIDDWDNDPTEVASNPDLLAELIKEGFEGFEDEGNAGFVLWNIPGFETRIKFADPITYDDEGHVIPLSQRFNESKEDMRYSYEGSGTKPRAAQAQRDEGYLLSEAKFYQLYSAHKIDIGKRFGDISEQIESIKSNGFISSTNLSNVMPTGAFRYVFRDFKGNIVYDNVVQARYAPRKGDIVMLVPSNQLTKMDAVKNGFKPFDYEIVQIEYDNQTYYEAYKHAYEKSNTKYSYEEADKEYLELAKDPKKNESKLRQLVEAAARRAGYISDLLFHGTNRFGFTKVDVTESDDKMSFFATDNELVAATYFYQPDESKVSREIGKHRDKKHSRPKPRVKQSRNSIKSY